MYGGEPFLKVGLPDYKANALELTVWLVTNTVLWLVAAWWWVRRQGPEPKHRAKQVNSQTTSGGGRRIIQSCLMYWLACGFVILGVRSAWNVPIARTVFQVPLLSPDECRDILDTAAKVAWRNYQSALQQKNQTTTDDVDWDLLQEPLGWHKTRPEAYQTTDLQPALDPFEPAERDNLRSLLDRRLGPTVARIYGVPVHAVRAQDMFLARYEPTGQRSLRRHEDDTDVSFNLLLSTNFTGGGTRFFNRLQERWSSHDENAGVFYHAQPRQAGTVLIHNSQILHEGVTVTTGTRFILVGFLTVDRRHPWTGVWYEGMSVYSGWFNFAWAQVRLREFAQRARKSNAMLPIRMIQGWIKSFSIVMGAFLLLVLDAFAPHKFKVLVDDENQDAFRQALDDQFTMDHRAAEDETKENNLANWFRGQQIVLDPWTGMLQSTFRPRQGKEAHFEEL